MERNKLALRLKKFILDLFFLHDEWSSLNVCGFQFRQIGNEVNKGGVVISVSFKNHYNYNSTNLNSSSNRFIYKFFQT